MKISLYPQEIRQTYLFSFPGKLNFEVSRSITRRYKNHTEKGIKCALHFATEMEILFNSFKQRVCPPYLIPESVEK